MDALSRAALTFFGQAETSESLDHLVGRFAPVARSAGFASAACHHIARPGHPIAPRTLFEWSLDDHDRRRLENILARTDAVIGRLFLSTAPIQLADLDRPALDAPAGLALSPSRGLIVPVHGPLGDIMAVTLLGGDTVIDAQSRLTLQAAATVFANRGAALADVEAEASPGREPSSREARCAHLARAGLNDWEIGQALGVTEDAIALHFDRLAAKFGVTRRADIPARDWLSIAQHDD
jgi:hypothetical protein